MWNGSIFFWRFLILMKWVSPSFPTIWVLRKLLDFSLNSTLPLFFLVVCWWKIIRRRFFGLFFVYMILWGLLIAGLLQSDYLFPFSLLYSPKPLHEPRVSLSTKELQTQSSAFQTLTQPHFASHKIPYQLRQRKKKKKKPGPKCVKNREDEAHQTFLTFLFPYISNPNPPQPQPLHKSELHAHKSD